VVEKTKDRMESIDDEAEPIELCGLPPSTMIVAKAVWSFALSFF
jgi:hypothetical protein